MTDIRILLVDDEQPVLNALQRFFRRSGYQVITCTSGRDGLALLESSEPFQLVISDYRMPEMNGVEFLKAVRTRWPDTVRMVLSGFADTSAIIAATNEGNIYKFIPKPWDEAFLLKSVQEAIEIHAASRRSKEQLQALSESIDCLDLLHAKNMNNQTITISAYHTLLDQMPVGLIGIDRNSEIVSMNERARLLLGLSIAPLGESAASVLNGIYDTVPDHYIPDQENRIITINAKQIRLLTKFLHEDKSDGVMLILVLLEEGA